MNKSELVEVLATRTSADRATVTAVIDGMVDVVTDKVVSGERVLITGFGVFEQRQRNPRVARNPRTGEAVAVASTVVPAFRPGAAFRAVVSATAAPAAPGKKATKAAKATKATKAVKAKADAKSDKSKGKKSSKKS
ncbi:MAG: integration host factor subunit beta [Geodermatophilaceae bacterium]|nr:integration host factor subunit beta [Geodermatophilaceae bacterium]